MTFKLKAVNRQQWKGMFFIQPVFYLNAEIKFSFTENNSQRLLNPEKAAKQSTHKPYLVSQLSPGWIFSPCEDLSPLFYHLPHQLTVPC